MITYNGTIITGVGGAWMTHSVPAPSAYTLRFRFDDDYSRTPPRPRTPGTSTPKGSWSRVVDMTGVVWDYTYENSDWSSLFLYWESHDDVIQNYESYPNDMYTANCRIIDSGDLSGVQAWYNTFGSQYGGFLHLSSVYIPATMSCGPSAVQADQMFAYCKDLETVNIYAMNVNCTEAFMGCSKLKTVTIQSTIQPQPAGNSTSAIRMFAGCSSLESVSLSFQRLGNLACPRMFFDCRSLTSAPSATDLPTSTVTDMSEMFMGCSSLTSIPAYDTGACVTMSYMFYGAGLVTAPALNTAACKNLSYMFFNCKSLTALPTYNYNSATNVNHMFHNTWNASGALAVYNVMSTYANITKHTGVFTQCGLNLPDYDTVMAQIPTSWGGTA